MFRPTVRSTLLAALVAAALAVTAAPATAAPTPAPETRPANDSFSSPQVLNGTSGSVAGTNVEATKRAGEPNHGGDPGGASVWYQWSPSATGIAHFGVCGEGAVFALAVYTGTSIDALTPVSSGTDLCPEVLEFGVAVGTTYRIAVDGIRFDTVDMGAFTLSWDSPVPGVQRPDVLVRPGTTGAWLGDDVYNTTGARQTSTASVRAGGTATFSFKFQNDGEDDTIRLRGSASTAGSGSRTWPAVPMAPWWTSPGC